MHVFVSILKQSLCWHHLHNVKMPKQFADLLHKLELKGSEIIENSRGLWQKMSGAFFGSMMEISSITLEEVTTVFVDPDNCKLSPNALIET
jgi:hypothetical protein